MFRFKFVAKILSGTTTTPELLNFTAKAILYPTPKDIIWTKVYVAKEMITMGGKSADIYAKMKACLEKCQLATSPITMVDIDGNTIYVRFLTLPQSLPWKEPVTDEKGRDRDYVYNLLMLKVPLA